MYTCYRLDCPRRRCGVFFFLFLLSSAYFYYYFYNCYYYYFFYLFLSSSSFFLFFFLLDFNHSLLFICDWYRFVYPPHKLFDCCYLNLLFCFCFLASIRWATSTYLLSIQKIRLIVSCVNLPTNQSNQLIECSHMSIPLDYSIQPPA